MRSVLLTAFVSALLAGGAGGAFAAKVEDSPDAVIADCGGSDLPKSEVDSCLERARVLDETNPTPALESLEANLEGRRDHESAKHAAISSPEGGAVTVEPLPGAPSQLHPNGDMQAYPSPPGAASPPLRHRQSDVQAESAPVESAPVESAPVENAPVESASAPPPPPPPVYRGPEDAGPSAEDMSDQPPIADPPDDARPYDGPPPGYEPPPSNDPPQ